MTTTIVLTIAFFLAVILILVGLLLFAKAKLSPSGKLKIVINGEQTLEVDGGSTLLTTLGTGTHHLKCGLMLWGGAMSSRKLFTGWPE